VKGLQAAREHSFWVSAALVALVILPFSVKAKIMADEKYLFSFKSHKSNCILKVNNLPAVDTYQAPMGTMAAGFNLTAFLADGSNKIELLIEGIDEKDYKKLEHDASCEVVITKATEKSSEELSRIKLMVNEHGYPTAVNSLHYQGNIYNSKIAESYSDQKEYSGMYQASSDLLLSGMPQWSWVKARPITEKDRPALRKAYEAIMVMIKNRDMPGLKQVTRISNEEMGAAENTSPAMMFISTDFPQHVVKKELTLEETIWEDFQLRTYCGGRLARLALGYYQTSPFRFQDTAGDVIFSYNPYFAIIDEKVVLVR
jgi:hypothetical protein